MNRTISALSLALTILAVANFAAWDTYAGHSEKANYEPFDAKSLDEPNVDNVGSACGGYTGAGGEGNQFVAAVQSLLYADVLYGPDTEYGDVVDGQWGPNSENALREWQDNHGLPVDGCFGEHSANHSQGNTNLNHMEPNDNGIEGQPIQGAETFYYLYQNLCDIPSCSNDVPHESEYVTRPEPNTIGRFQERAAFDGAGTPAIFCSSRCVKTFINCTDVPYNLCEVY